MNRIIIAGSRSFNDYATASSIISNLFSEFEFLPNEIEIVSGHANGADKLGERFAKEHNIKLVTFPADWKTYGNTAGHIRNAEMAMYAKNGYLIAFWDGKSTGTKNMIDAAKRNNIEVFVYKYGENKNDIFM